MPQRQVAPRRTGYPWLSPSPQPLPLEPGVVHARVHHARGVDEHRHVAVARGVTAVLGDLGAAGVDDADLYATEPVPVARIGVGDPEERRGLVTGEDLRQTRVRNLHAAGAIAAS